MTQPNRRPCVLVFAGADPSGGAGIQADIEAIAAMGAHAMPVITALTVQDNDRVFSVHPVDADLVMQQAQVLIKKMTIAAVKIGIVGNRANAEAIAVLLKERRAYQPPLPLVLDTVLASGHGDALHTEDAVTSLASLMPLASLLTPNLNESARLCAGEQELDGQAEVLLRACPNVLIKGGHSNDPSNVTNHWFSKSESRSWTWPRLPGAFHGTGCTLASAIAALLARGKSMLEAIEQAQLYCNESLVSAYVIADGQQIPNRSNGEAN